MYLSVAPPGHLYAFLNIQTEYLSQGYVSQLNIQQGSAGGAGLRYTNKHNGEK